MDNFKAKIAPYLGTFQNPKQLEIDYFLNFKENGLAKIDKQILHRLGSWHKYGNRGYRGWSKLSKEELYAAFAQYMNITQAELEIINANNELFRIK